MHHLPAAGLAALAVALLVGLPEVLGDVGRLAAVLVLQLGLVLTWVLTTGIQGFAGSLAVGSAAAVAADLALVLPVRGSMGGLLVVFGLGFLAAVLQQMFRRARPDLVASLSGGVLLFCAVGALAALLLVGRSPGGPDRALVVLLAVGAALVGGHLVDLVLPRPRLAAGVPRGLPGLATAVAAGAAVTLAGRELVEPAGAGRPRRRRGARPDHGTDGARGELHRRGGRRARRGRNAGDGVTSPWVLAVVQAVLPLSACAPVALALLAVL